MNDTNHKEEYLIRVKQEHMGLLRHYLSYIQFKTEPLIERVNPDLYNCVVTAHNGLEQWAAIGLSRAFDSEHFMHNQLQRLATLQQKAAR